MRDACPGPDERTDPLRPAGTSPTCVREDPHAARPNGREKSAVLRQLSSTTKVGEVLTPDMLRGSGGGCRVKKLSAEVSSFPGFPQEKPGSRSVSYFFVASSVSLRHIRFSNLLKFDL